MPYFLMLFALLGDPVFEVRESAQSEMARMIDRHPTTYGPALGEWHRGATEPEVRARSARLLVAYSRHRINTFVPKSVPVWPRADMMPFRLLGCDVRADLIGSNPEWWIVTAYVQPADQRRSTSNYIRDQLRRGMSEDEANALLARMWKIELQIIRLYWPDYGSSWAGWSGGFPEEYSQPYEPWNERP